MLPWNKCLPDSRWKKCIKMYSRNKENLVQSENDFVGSHGFQHGTKRGVGIQSSLTEYKKKKKSRKLTVAVSKMSFFLE